MIEHIFIKNYKAFPKENIQLDKNTVLIGTNNTGKTTVFEALDVFFNHTINHSYILDKSKDVVVEIHINETRYRKTFSPPHYFLNFDLSIGNMYEINHIKYIYIPKELHIPTLLNQILSINLTTKPNEEELFKICKVSDYIDGVLGNSTYPIFSINTDIKMHIPETLTYSKEVLLDIVSNITYQYVILGIDQIEENFEIDHLESLTTYTYQTIFSTSKKFLASDHHYTVVHLYKGNQLEDYDTIKKRVEKNNQTYLLVEGKYDVNWFETALKLLDKEEEYTVIPCGGSGNIAFVKTQLEKEGFKTLTITDGDTKKKGSLKREVIEQYADISYINERFQTNFTHMPKEKYLFFKAFTVKDDVVKNVLSRWAKKHLTKEHQFVKEVNNLLT